MAHTEFTLEDDQAISGTKTFTGPINYKNLGGVRCIDAANSQGWTGSDVGAWINSAIADLGANGGTIFIAAGSYSFSTQINADNKRSLTIRGAGAITQGAVASTSLTYTGTTTPVSARSSVGFCLSGVQLYWNNAAFATNVVDLSHSGGGSDAENAEIDHCYFGSTGPGGYATRVINADKTIVSAFHHNVFQGYYVGIGGAADSTSYSDSIQVENNSFSNSTGVAITAHIQNPTQAWLIKGNTFEMGSGAGTPSIIAFTVGAAGVGLTFVGNWVGDHGAGAFTDINLSGGGWLISGNYFGGNASSTAIASTSAFSGGLAVIGNRFDSWLTAVNFGAAISQVIYSGNSYNTVTNQLVGQSNFAVDLTAQTAAVGTTTLYAVPAAGPGQYRISWNAKVTTVAGTSSTLGALTITYTDPDGIVQTITAGALNNAGAIVTTKTDNSTTTVMLGVPILINAKASTNIQYAFAYASNPANAMNYNLHIKVEAL